MTTVVTVIAAPGFNEYLLKFNAGDWAAFDGIATSGTAGQSSTKELRFDLDSGSKFGYGYLAVDLEDNVLDVSFHVDVDFHNLLAATDEMSLIRVFDDFQEIAKLIAVHDGANVTIYGSGIDNDLNWHDTSAINVLANGEFTIMLGLRLHHTAFVRVTYGATEEDSSAFDNTDFYPDHARYGPQEISVSNSGHITMDNCSMYRALGST